MSRELLSMLSRSAKAGEPITSDWTMVEHQPEHEMPHEPDAAFGNPLPDATAALIFVLWRLTGIGRIVLVSEGTVTPIVLDGTLTSGCLLSVATTAWPISGSERQQVAVEGEDQGSLALRVTRPPGTQGPPAAFDTALSSGTVAALLLSQLAGLITTAISAMASDRDRPLANIPLLTPTQLDTLWRTSFHGLRMDFPPLTVAELLKRAVEDWPDRIAVCHGAETLSYLALWRRVEDLAAGLMALGLRAGARVGINLPRGLDWIVAQFGTIRAGAVYVPLNPRNPPERNHAIMEAADIDWIIGESGLLHDGPSALTMASLERDGHALSRPRWTQRTPDDEVVILFTSGSTGTPKGIRLSNQALCNFLQTFPAAFAVENPQDLVFLQFCECSFDGSLFEVFPAIAHGGQVVIDEVADLLACDMLASRLEKNAVNAAFLPTSMWRLWREQIRRGKSRFPDTLRLVVIGGELPEPALFSLAGCPDQLRLFNGYGPTETTMCVTAQEITRDIPTEGAVYLVTGRPMPNVTILVLGHDLLPLPPGMAGEIAIGGPGVALGYLNASEADHSRFKVWTRPDDVVERLYCTGDFGYYDSNGYLVCLGRADNQVKIDGFRVELTEIEAQLHAHPYISNAVVTYQSDPRGGRGILGMYLVLADDVPGREVAVREVASALRARLPAYMVPWRYTIMLEFPLNLHGKIDRRSLYALPLDELPEVPRGDVNLTKTEAALCTLWRRTRRSEEQIALDDDLLCIEPSSLRRGMFLAEVFDHFDLDAPPDHLTRLRTIKSLALGVDSWLTDKTLQAKEKSTGLAP